VKNEITDKPINCINYRDDDNYTYVKDILLDYVSKKIISLREIERRTGCNAKVLSNFIRKNYNIKFYNFCKIYDFVNSLKNVSNDNEFNVVNYVEYADKARDELIDIISEKRLTILFLSNEIGIHPETLSSFFKKQRQVTYANFLKIYSYLKKIKDKDE
jgi:lambda repressor-like predicted transcriptional regulator